MSQQVHFFHAGRSDGDKVKDICDVTDMTDWTDSQTATCIVNQGINELNEIYFRDKVQFYH